MNLLQYLCTQIILTIHIASDNLAVSDIKLALLCINYVVIFCTLAYWQLYCIASQNTTLKIAYTTFTRVNIWDYADLVKYIYHMRN